MMRLFFILSALFSTPYYNLLLEENYKILNKELKNQRKRFLDFLIAHHSFFENKYNLIYLYLKRGLKDEKKIDQSLLKLTDQKKKIDNIFKTIYLLGVKIIYVNGITSIEKEYIDIFNSEFKNLNNLYLNIGNTDSKLKSKYANKISDISNELVKNCEKLKYELLKVKYL